MTDSLERKLQQALSASDPGELFTARVLARLPPATARPIMGRAPARRWAWISGAVAASLLVVVSVRQQVLEQRQIAQAKYAKQQLLVALRITSEQLDLAQRSVGRQTE